MAAILDFKMAATYFETFVLAIGLLSPKNMGKGVKTVLISLLLNKILR